jgi:hypothetical protein
VQNQSLLNSLQLASTIVALLLGGASVLAFVYKKYTATLGRRHLLAANLRRLSCNMQLRYLEYVLGVPAFRRPAPMGHTVHIWAEPEVYVQALVAEDVVLALSITIRDRRFTPTLFEGHTISGKGESLEITLGKTAFSDLPYQPAGVLGSVGARRYFYHEKYWYGNPGNYQYCVFSINDAGFIHPQSFLLLEALVEGSGVSLGEFESPAHNANGDVAPYLSKAVIDQGRRRARPNTVTTIAPNGGFTEIDYLHPDNLHDFSVLGPDEDYVRVVQTPESLSAVRRWVRKLGVRLRRPPGN